TPRWEQGMELESIVSCTYQCPLSFASGWGFTVTAGRRRAGARRHGLLREHGHDLLLIRGLRFAPVVDERLLRGRMPLLEAFALERLLVHAQVHRVVLPRHHARQRLGIRAVEQ